MESKTSVVITGIGPMCSIGVGKDELWESVKNEKTQLVQEHFFEGKESLGSFYIHKVKKFDIRDFGLDAEILEWIKDWKNGTEDMDLMYLAAVSKLALEDSRLSYEPVNNNIGFVVTHENPGLEDFFNASLSHAYDYLEHNKNAKKSDFIRQVYERCERKGYDTQSFMYLYFLGKIFSTHGFSLYVNNACASGLFAIETASQLIREKRCSAVIVAGADRQRMIYKHWWLKSLGLYAEDGLIKPYSKNRNGFVMGEGGAALVLESRENAEKRGAHIYAEYLGGGFNLEGGRVSLPTVEKDYYLQCIQEALANANVAARDIDIISPHGIGTSITDLHEARTISSAFSGPNGYIVSAFKPYFGHNLGSCALLETSLLLLAMASDYVPRTLNCEPVDPQIKINLAVKAISKNLKTALKLSCGFAGYNGAAIFRKP